MKKHTNFRKKFNFILFFMHFTLYISKTLKSVSLNEIFGIFAGGTFLPQKDRAKGIEPGLPG